MGLFGIIGPAFAAGFAVAASPGAAAALSIGLGAATADAFYVALALAGVLPLLAAADWLSTVLLLVGGSVLFLLGLAALRGGAALREESVGAPAAGITDSRAPYLVGLAATLANPSTIAAWLAITGGLLSSADLGDGTLAVGLSGALTLAAIFAGSAAWFIMLALAVAALRARIGVRQVRVAAMAAGLVLAALGLLLAVRGAGGLLD